MKVRLPLFTRVVGWFFLSVVVVGAAVLVLFRQQFQLDASSLVRIESRERLHAVARLLIPEIRSAEREEWTALLEKFSEAYGVTFLICDHEGAPLAGPARDIPGDVASAAAALTSPGAGRRGPPRPGMERGGPRPLPPQFTLKTNNPRRYWAGIAIPVSREDLGPEAHGALIAVSDSLAGNAFFFDPRPWIVVLAALVALSAALWIPMVRGITSPISKITKATHDIARGKFDVKVDVRRTDELGDLAASINDMAARLDALVKGQKRFLGDVAHELASPVGRIQLALGILQEKLGGAEKERVGDVVEEAEHMAALVDELLAFSRAEITPGKVRLEPVEIEPVLRRVADREGGGAAVSVRAEAGLTARADAELLSRALANLVRNAVRYAGGAGPIVVEGRRENGKVFIDVRDGGPGVPAADLPRLFEPFFRPDPSRERATGGVGLGLAIVKTCVATCGGDVSARNLSPGFSVTVELDAA
ncbi:MAG: HAMP domain-containing histidine kinase [Deltaproteobacteria bacterium]|nr:HAMP domain-containing histidine kinase [Deltaproteobacteria bacterium]